VTGKLYPHVLPLLQRAIRLYYYFQIITFLIAFVFILIRNGFHRNEVAYNK
jgi:hypothetical protein